MPPLLPAAGHFFGLRGTLFFVATALIIFLITYLFIGLRQIPRIHIDLLTSTLVGALITVITMAAGILVLVVEVKIARGAESARTVRPEREMTVTVNPARPGGLLRTFRVVLRCETPDQQRKGLQGFRQLSADEAALFPYPKPVEVTFWMGSVTFPLDIIFVSPDMIVARVYPDCRPGQDARYPSGVPVRYVIETAAGSGIRAGDMVSLGGAGGPGRGARERE